MNVFNCLRIKYQFSQQKKNEILVLKTKHYTSICSWQYTPNINYFCLYIIAQIQLDNSKSNREDYTYTLVYHF